MSANVPRGTNAALTWHEPGIPAYHIESTCGRYTVSRMTSSAQGVVYYIAWRVRRGEKNRIVGRAELGSTAVPIDAEESQHADARRRMRQRCAEDAAKSLSTDQPHTETVSP